MVERNVKPSDPITVQEVQGWFRIGTRKTCIPNEADLRRLTHLVNKYRQFKFERDERDRRQANPNPEVRRPDLDSVKNVRMLSDVQKNIAALQETLPKLLALYGTPKLPPAELGPLKSLYNSVTEAAKLIGTPRKRGAPAGAPQRRKADKRVPNAVWPAYIGPLSERIMAAWKVAGRPVVSHKKADGPLVRVLCLALDAIEGESFDADRIADHLKANPPPWVSIKRNTTPRSNA